MASDDDHSLTINTTIGKLRRGGSRRGSLGGGTHTGGGGGTVILGLIVKPIFWEF